MMSSIKEEQGKKVELTNQFCREDGYTNHDHNVGTHEIASSSRIV